MSEGATAQQILAVVAAIVLIAVLYVVYRVARRWTGNRESPAAPPTARAAPRLQQTPAAELRSIGEAGRERDVSLVFARSAVSAAVEASPDAVLVVDAGGHVISCNQRFLDLWQITPEVAAARLDGAVQAAMAAQMPEPAAFRARIEHLYAHPDESGHERLSRKDGRAIERYTKGLYGAGREYLGRIWFFRDITQSERAIADLRESEARFRTIFDNAREGIVLVDYDSRTFSTANPSFCAMLGYSLEEIRTLRVDDIHPADALAHILDEFKRHVPRAPQALVDAPAIRKDGSVLFVDITSARVEIADKPFILALFRDVTERKRADRAVKDALARVQAQLEATGRIGQAEALLSGDVDALARDITEIAARTAKCERANVWLFNDAETELHCIDLYETTPAKHSKGLVLREQEFANEMRVVKAEKYVNADDALTDARTRGYVESYVKPLRITSMLDVAIQASGRTFGLLCLEHVDRPHHWEPDEIAFVSQLADKIGIAVVSRRRREAEAALKQSEERFKAIFDNVRDGILLVDTETKAVFSGNARMCEMLGYSLEALATLRIADLHPASEVPRVLREFAERQPGTQHVVMDVAFRRSDGSVLFADITASEVSFGGRTYALTVVRDVTDRKAAEEAVRRSEEKYRNLVESTTDYIWEVDEKGNYTYVSPNTTAMLGYSVEEMLGKSPFDFMDPDESRRVAQAFAALAAEHQPFSQLENTAIAKDGRRIVLETSGMPIVDDDGAYRGYRGIDRNITRRKETERALRRRDALLHAAAVGAAELAKAANIDEGVHKSLDLVCTAMEIDRMNVFERHPEQGRAPTLRYAWESENVPVKFGPGFFEQPVFQTREFSAWSAPVAAGRTMATDVRTAPPVVKELFESIGVKKNLMIPIMVDGKYWGEIGIDTGDQTRVWSDFEIEVMQTLAELIGTSIQRDRYVREIADANRIVQNTPTILFRLAGEPGLPMIYVSQNVRLFGYEPSMMLKSPQLYKSLVHPDDIEKFNEAQAYLLEATGTGVIEYRLLTSRGDYRWVEIRYTPVRDAAGRLVEIEGLAVDVTERKAAEEKIARLARTDPLTGLANRSTFIERLRQLFASARRGGAPFAVLYLDLDRFKDINDTLGHPVGDDLLVVASERLSGGIRETDLVARLGGDEFAVLQADTSDPSQAGAMATKLRAALAEPVRISGNDIHVTASLGIAMYGPDCVVPEDLLSHADIALYRAKEEGRDQYRFHTDEIDRQVRAEVEMTEELRHAVDRGEFELHYQPQVELATNRIVGMEALIRWKHPARGLLAPSAFLDIAERTGLMHAIGQWALDRACDQMHLWRLAGIAPPTIAVNVSYNEMKGGAEFVDLVTATLAKWQLAPHDLELDVTESTLARATAARNDVLERLQASGVNISIDEFGTKYSTLDYIRMYRVNRLKIPRSLTSSAARDPQSAALLRAIAGIARELGIELIAQGVETVDQWTFLTATSPVAKVQGFYYSEPVPAARAEELLRSGKISPQPGDVARAS